jgi:thiol-disulfide isomerase/thioredoxin
MVKIQNFFFLLSLFFLTHLFSQSLEQVKPWMGVNIDKGINGVIIKGVISGTPSEKVGLKSGDEILSIDSTKVTSPSELISYIQSKGVGTEVKVHFLREKKSKSLSLKLEAKPDQTELIKKQLLGKKLPELKLETLDGKFFTNKDLKNGITIIEFWATWCGPCRATHETLSKFSKDNPKINVLAISSEEMDLIKNYSQKEKKSFIILRDVDNKIHSYFSVYSIPTTILLNKEGVVTEVAIGGGFYLDEVLKKAVAMSK